MKRMCFKIVGIVLLLLPLSGCIKTPCPDFIPLPKRLPPPPPLDNIEVALVLSGGGGRAIAHAGVIEVLEQNQVPINLIVGCSAGSIIGALYADDPNAKRLKKKIIGLRKWDLLDLDLSSSIKMLWRLQGLVRGNALRYFLQHSLRSKYFSSLAIPLVVVTTDVSHGKTFSIRSGPIIPAIHASSAIPMIFHPVSLYGKILVDGGIASPVPVEVAKKFSPKIVIAVDIGTNPPKGPIHNTYQLTVRSMHISYFKLANWQTQQADIVIYPAVDGFGMFCDHENEKLYQSGKKAAQAALPLIQQLLKSQGL